MLRIADVVQILMEAGADINAVDDDNRPPRVWAVLSSRGTSFEVRPEFLVQICSGRVLQIMKMLGDTTGRSSTLSRNHPGAEEVQEEARQQRQIIADEAKAKARLTRIVYRLKNRAVLQCFFKWSNFYRKAVEARETALGDD